MTSPEDILDLLGLDTTYSPESVAKIDAEIDKLDPKIAKAKEARNAAKDTQLEIKAQRDDLIAAKALLYGNRTARPGDVVVGG